VPKRLEGSNPFSRIGMSAAGAARCREYAGIAQLVELHLAKVDVAGSSPVSRSKVEAAHAAAACRLFSTLSASVILKV
jgi:hypothetical protein